jgi:hypothetical protein
MPIFLQSISPDEMQQDLQHIISKAAGSMPVCHMLPVYRENAKMKRCGFYFSRSGHTFMARGEAVSWRQYPWLLRFLAA